MSQISATFYFDYSSAHSWHSLKQLRGLLPAALQLWRSLSPHMLSTCCLLFPTSKPSQLDLGKVIVGVRGSNAALLYSPYIASGCVFWSLSIENQIKHKPDCKMCCCSMKTVSIALNLKYDTQAALFKLFGLHDKWMDKSFLS